MPVGQVAQPFCRRPTRMRNRSPPGGTRAWLKVAPVVWGRACGMGGVLFSQGIPTPPECTGHAAGSQEKTGFGTRLAFGSHSTPGGGPRDVSARPRLARRGVRRPLLPASHRLVLSSGSEGRWKRQAGPGGTPAAGGPSLGGARGSAEQPVSGPMERGLASARPGGFRPALPVPGSAQCGRSGRRTRALDLRLAQQCSVRHRSNFQPIRALNARLSRYGA